MRFARFVVPCSMVLAAALLATCSSGDDDPPVETLAQVVARVARTTERNERTPADEPSSYRIEFARYTAGLADATKTVGAGSNRRRRLKATRIVRAVVRPFNHAGDVRRSIGFVREAAAADGRVTFVRPVPEDPRPRVYPPPAEPGSRDFVIAGRECRTHQVDADTYCVDDAGLVLMTQSKQSLEVARKVTVGNTGKTATELKEPLAEGFANVHRGSIRPIDPDSSPPGTDWSLDRPPGTFELVGRYAVAPLSAEVLKRDSRKVIANIVDVYVSGIDAVVVERGGKLDTSDVGVEDLGSLGQERDLDLGALGAAKVGIGGIGAFGYREVRAFPSQGRYVVVAGTLPEGQLIEIARSLRSRTGTAIRYLDS